MAIELDNHEFRQLKRVGRPRQETPKVAETICYDKAVIDAFKADAWLLILIEVEGRLSGRKALRRFSWRMYEYRHRIQVRIMQQRDLDLPPLIYSLGVLLENRGVGERLTYTEEHLGQGVIF